MENKQNQFEQSGDTLYNSSSDGVIRIDRRTLKPNHNPKCDHRFALDPSDADSVAFDVYKCAQEGCPVGYLADKL